MFSYGVLARRMFGARPRNTSRACFVTTMRRGVTRTEASRPDASSSYVALRPMPSACCTSVGVSTSPSSPSVRAVFMMRAPEKENPERCARGFAVILMGANRGCDRARLLSRTAVLVVKHLRGVSQRVSWVSISACGTARAVAVTPVYKAVAPTTAISPVLRVDRASVRRAIRRVCSDGVYSGYTLLTNSALQRCNERPMYDEFSRRKPVAVRTAPAALHAQLGTSAGSPGLRPRSARGDKVGVASLSPDP